MVTPDQKREAAQNLITEHGMSERQACDQLALPRSTCSYKKRIKDDDPVMEALNKLIDKHPSISPPPCLRTEPCARARDRVEENWKQVYLRHSPCSHQQPNLSLFIGEGKRLVIRRVLRLRKTL